MVRIAKIFGAVGNRVIASDIPPKRKGRGCKVA
jgi:hypothetical protein